MAQQDLNPIEENWDAGVVRHLLPAVNHSTFLIKASFNRPLESAPTLRIREGSNRRETVGILNDTAGQFWQFYTSDLRPDTQYELTLRDGAGNSLCESWPLSTFPSPQQNPDRVKVIFYTCAGGREGNISASGTVETIYPLRFAKNFTERPVLRTTSHDCQWRSHLLGSAHLAGRTGGRIKCAGTTVQL